MSINMSQITAISTVWSTAYLIRVYMKVSIKASHHWSVVGVSTRDGWIPFTKRAAFVVNVFSLSHHTAKDFLRPHSWVVGSVEFGKMATIWWRHQMETFSALLAICAGNSPVPGEFPAQWPVTRNIDIFFDLCLNKRLSKQSWGCWFETLSRPLWRHCNDIRRMRVL